MDFEEIALSAIDGDKGKDKAREYLFYNSIYQAAKNDFFESVYREAAHNTEQKRRALLRH
jgi:DNA-binding FadR family transcriptional regulator